MITAMHIYPIFKIQEHLGKQSSKIYNEINEFQYHHKIHLVILNWCLDYWYLKNQFIYERNILVPFRADREEIFQNKSNEISKLSSLIHENKPQQNLFQLLLSVLTFAVYLYCIRNLSRCFSFFPQSCNNLNKAQTKGAIQEELFRNLLYLRRNYGGSLCRCSTFQTFDSKSLLFCVVFFLLLCLYCQ